MKIIGHNIIFKSAPNDKVSKVLETRFEHTQTDKAEMKYHKGEVIDVGEAIDFMGKGDFFYYDQSRAYQTVINGDTVFITQAPFVILVLDETD